MAPPPLANEAARLAALHRYRILDTEPEQCFDDLTLLASHICGTPMALLTLVDAERQWFKSRIGVAMTETARAVSFCGHAIQHRDPLYRRFLSPTSETMEPFSFVTAPFERMREEEPG